MTSSAVGWPDGLTGTEALRRYAPAVGDVLDRLVRTRSCPARFVVLARLACATAQELVPLPAPPSAGPLDDRVVAGDWSSTSGVDQTVLRFAEQFSVDVSALDESLRADLWAALGEGPREARGRFLAMAWVADLLPRVSATLDRLFAASPQLPVTGEELVVDDATPLAHEFVRVVYNLHELDPVLSEMVRLRGAHAHNCRLCKSIVNRAALTAGATLTDFAAVEAQEPSTLSAPQQAALALVDAMLWYPARMPEEVLDGIRREFTPAQAVELVLDVMRNAWNKTTVAAVMDEAHVADGVEVYEYRDDGTTRFGLAAPVASAP